MIGSNRICRTVCVAKASTRSAAEIKYCPVATDMVHPDKPIQLVFLSLIRKSPSTESAKTKSQPMIDYSFSVAIPSRIIGLSTRRMLTTKLGCCFLPDYYR